LSRNNSNIENEFTISPIAWHLILLGGVIGTFITNISLGSVYISLEEIFAVISGIGPKSVAAHDIIRNIRIPRAVTAILAGGALSVSGLQMQTLFRNPLAGPSVLGITAGASLGVAIVLLGSGAAGLFAVNQWDFLGSWIIVIAASAGSAGVLAVIIAVSLRVRDNVTLLIVGLMIGNMTIALVSIWQFFSNPEQIQDYLIWVFGSLGGVYDRQLLLLTGLVIIGSLVTFGMAKSMNGFLLGENYAKSMGISVPRTRLLLIITTSLLAGAVTAFCGPIGFIGIAVPHLVRSLFNTNNHQFLVPGTLLMGALLMLVCDIVAQLPGSAHVLPISSVTALIGSPVVIWVIIKQKNLQGAFS